MRKAIPSLNALRAFEAAARHLSYQKAAEELNVTAAAVKQLVSKLENSLDARLLVRNGRKLELSDAGRRGRPELQAGMENLARSVEKMRQEIEHRQLIVTVETSFATTWLVPKLDQFRKAHPQISVLIDSNQQIVDLQSGEADVAIRYGVDTPSNHFTHRLFDDRIFPACSPALAKGPPAIRKLSDLRNSTLIHWDLSAMPWAETTRNWFSWESWSRHMEANLINSGHGLYFSDYGQAVQAAIAGQGVILASWPILKEPLDAGCLVSPFEENLSTAIGYDVVTTQQARQRKEVKAFVDWVIGVAAQDC